jgi:glycerophosphoryl diester phosphodiesterase
MYKLYFIMFTTFIVSAQNQQHQETLPLQNDKYEFDLQGHRGARGLAPENTLQAFVKAFTLGVNTLEMDVVITKDKQVVVSHEPWMHSNICKQPDGALISKEDERSFNIYQMTYQEVKQFDCGTLYFDQFPEQELTFAQKPLLKDVLQMMDSLAKNHGRKIHYNIELKSLPEGDGIYHPTPGIFSDLVVDLIASESKLERVSLQSFDFRVLNYLHKTHPEIELAALVYEEDFESAMERLGFTPHIYSPYYKQVDKKLVKKVQALGIKIIPWTVNEISDMKRLLKQGVDGLITDYPDKAIALRK